MKKSTAATYVSTSVLLGMLVVLMIPSNIAESPSGLALYGMATISQQNANGDTIFTQTVHNQLFDAGEDFLLDNAFKGLTDVADNIDIGSICLSEDATHTSDETDTASTWNTDHDAADDGGASTLTNCRTDGTVTKSGQVATIGPLVFLAKADNSAGTHWFAGTGAANTVTNIAICQADSGNADVRGCATTLFAVVNTSDVVLDVDETVTVTYTFSLASPGT